MKTGTDDDVILTKSFTREHIGRLFKVSFTRIDLSYIRENFYLERMYISRVMPMKAMGSGNYGTPCIRVLMDV